MNKSNRKVTKRLKNPYVPLDESPLITGRIDVTADFMGTKEDYLKALRHQLKALEADMIAAYEEMYGQATN